MSETRVLELRTQRGWTQERLAERSGVTTRTVQRLEAGNDVSLDTLSRLGRALGVPVRDLFVQVPDAAQGRTAPAVDEDEARRFCAAARVAWRSTARAVALFVTSPVPVVLLIAAADEGVVPTSVEAAIAVGLGFLLLMAVSGSLDLLRASAALSPFRVVRYEEAPVGVRAARWVQGIGRTQREHRAASLALAVVLWTASPLPLIVVALLGPATLEGLWIAGATTFLLVSAACGLFVVLRSAWSPYVVAKLTLGLRDLAVR